MGSKQRIEDVASPVIMQRGPRSPWLEQLHHPTLFQSSSSFVEGMIPIQDREYQGFAPTTRREHMGRMGREKAVDHCGDRQTS